MHSIAKGVLSALRDQPLALPVVIVNSMCLAIVGFVLYSVAARSEARDRMLVELIQKCKG